MAKYLLIESRDPSEHHEVLEHYQLAAVLALEGHEVTLVLTQNAVLAARRGVYSGQLAKLAAGGVTVIADELSLREHAIADDWIALGVTAASLEVVIDEIEEGAKALLH